VHEAVEHPRLILASASPRRRQLLEQIGVNVEVRPVDIDETPAANESPLQLVERLSDSKAMQCLRRSEAKPMDLLWLGADTVIDIDGIIAGKPESEEHAVEMLLQLADREHMVRTGVCLYTHPAEQRYCCVVSTTVRFGRVTKAQAQQYWATGEPAGKAGSYAIQGRGAQFVAHISGSYSNVVGLPLYETRELLRAAAPEFLHNAQAG